MGVIRNLLAAGFVALAFGLATGLPVQAQRAEVSQPDDDYADFIRQLQQIKVEVNARADESAAAANQVQCDREECERLAKEMRTLYDRFINRLETTPQTHKPAGVPPTKAPQRFVPEVRLYVPATWECQFCGPQADSLGAAGIAYEEYHVDGLGSYPQVWISRPDGKWRFFTGAVPAASVQAEINAAKQQPASLPPAPPASPDGDASAGEVLSPDQQPTSIEEVRRVLQLLKPLPDETFVDFGCGDGRWCIEAARTYGCRSVGIEIDPERAEVARQNVSDAGLSDRVTIITGDATTTDVTADVGVAYLWPDVLAKLSRKIRRLDRFVSYMHPVAGVVMTEYDGAWLWRSPKPTVTVVPQQRTAVWRGYQYRSPVCNSPYCAMCNSIRRQLGM